MLYCIYGGMCFFECQEIKDVFLYLCLIVNCNDDVVFECVVNILMWGIGDWMLDVVCQILCDCQLIFWQVCCELLQEKVFVGCVVSVLQWFMELIDVLVQEIVDMLLYVQIDWVIKDFGLCIMYEQEKGEKGQMCIENLEELVMVMCQFSYNEEDEDLMLLQVFFFYVVLEVGEGQVDIWQDVVQLMMLYLVKGLEFLQVFIVGMEEGMFLSQMLLDEGGCLEEECCLVYVGVICVMQKLMLIYVEICCLYGKEVYYCLLCFIGELLEECVEEVCLCVMVSCLVSYQCMGMLMVENDSGYKFGQCVCYVKFGEGIIVNMEGSGEYSCLQVVFQGQGIKWLVVVYVWLEMV